MEMLVVKYDTGTDKMPDSCEECPVIRNYLERCPCDIWYWKDYDMQLLYSRYRKKRHKDCPLILEEV